MESRKTLLIVASVSFFLLVVVSAGLWLFWPESQDGTVAESEDVRPIINGGADTFEFYKGREELPGFEPEEEPEEPVEEELTLTFGELEEKPTEEIEEKLTVTIAPQREEERRTPPPAEVTEPEPTPSRPSPPPKPRIVSVREYEIQAGSYKSQSRAEALGKTLREKGLSSVIRTYGVSGETYYRVRIGPFSDWNEANKFLNWIRDIDGLKSSYISQVTRQRTIN
jgi:cell division protein FtsN